MRRGVKRRPTSGPVPTTFPAIITYAMRAAKEDDRKLYIGPDASLYIARPPQDRLCYEVYPGGRVVEWKSPTPPSSSA